MKEICKFKAYVNNALPFGKSGLCKVKSISFGHSIYVEIPREMSPYKDQDYWQVMWKDMDLIQFTGLHDNNGKEIFEGDWILIDGETKQYVYWHEGDGRWAFGNSHNKIGKGLRVDLWGTKYRYKEYEVIGNLYETKEAREKYNQDKIEQSRWVEGYKPELLKEID